MQAINPVDVHVEKEWRVGSAVKKNVKTSSNTNRTAPRMRTQVVNKTKPKKTKPIVSPSPKIPKQVVVPKLVLPVRSSSSSPNREPWVPPPGRSTKGQKVSWQSPESRLEINPVTEIIINDGDSQNIKSDRQNSTNNSQTNTLSTYEDEKLMREIQNYEKRIQGLIDGIGMLKERMHNHANTPDQTNQLRSDIDSSLYELEQLQQDYTKRLSSQTTKISRARSLSPIRNKNRSSSADEQRHKRTTTPRVSFQDDPIITKRRARSTTPIKGPLYLNPDRERLLISLTESEADVAQITKQLSSVNDILIKLKFEDKPLSFEVEQLYQHRNQLLHLIEQFERSNSKLREFLRHQYHLEAEHGIINDKYDTYKTHIHELENENQQIRHLLLSRENDNIALLTELERIRTHTIGFDTMKTSLEHNRAHLQRELYAREGEINRLQCIIRTLERDLQRNRFPSDNIPRSNKRTPMFSTSSCSSPLNVVSKKKAITVEKLQAELYNRDHQINELKQKLGDNKSEQTDDPNSEILQLRAKLQQAELVISEYKAQLHTETLKTSANNSKNHLSEIELERIRARLQKRIEELEPLPDLLKQVESKNEKLQKHIHELEKRFSGQSMTSIDRSKDNHSSFNDDTRTLQRKIVSLEDQNEDLLKKLNKKEEELHIVQSRLNSKTYDITSINTQIDSKNTHYQVRDDAYSSKNTFDLEQQISRLHLEYAQLKREKDEVERRYTSQLSELRDKLEQSNNTNRTMQNYVNSLKTTYTTLFNDSIPTSFKHYTTT
ncbi:unnamed protein product [Adineta steineri]|uniref:Uncharacterized protein n=1 Tax=Adineta steineri TaxID=433720 RepID=A0A813R9D9_9BILA|nr:unnamed protein product [Adineta steineri]CAF0908100.1 unnamed protein product [Adineta steineri]